MSPDNISLARAMAVRRFTESERTHRRGAEIWGEQYIPYHPLLREEIIRGHTGINERILAGQIDITPAVTQASTTEIFETIGDDVFDVVAQDMQKASPGPLQVTGSQFRSLSIARNNSFALFAAKLETKDPGRLLKELSIANQLSTEKGIAPAAVYTEDDHYDELMRRSYTAEEFAKLGLSVSRQFTIDSMTKITINEVLAFAQVMDQAAGEPAMSQDESEASRQILLDDFDFKEDVKTLTLQSRRVFKTLLGEQIVRFWGSQGAESLPPRVKIVIFASQGRPSRAGSADDLSTTD